MAAGKLVGDSLLSAAFVSYAGPFTIPFRQQLVTESWLPDLNQRGIPLTPGFLPLQLLTSDSLKVSTAWHSTCPRRYMHLQLSICRP